MQSDNVGGPLNLKFTGLTQNLGQLLRLLQGFSVKLLGQLANFGPTLWVLPPRYGLENIVYVTGKDAAEPSGWIMSDDSQALRGPGALGRLYLRRVDREIAVWMRD